jgi:hypothetical protein
MNDRNWLRRVPLQKAPPLPDRPAGTTRTVERLDDAAALELLATAPYGRLVYVRHARPEIRPLSHIVDGGEVIVRTPYESGLSTVPWNCLSAPVSRLGPMDLQSMIARGACLQRGVACSGRLGEQGRTGSFQTCCRDPVRRARDVVQPRRVEVPDRLRVNNSMSHRTHTTKRASGGQV